MLTSLILTATLYHAKFTGRKTASGRPYNPSELVAASNKFRLGQKLLVCGKERCARVTVIDRMSKRFPKRIDLSAEAGRIIGCSGKCRVIIFE